MVWRLLLSFLLLVIAVGVPVTATPAADLTEVRFATFNTSLNLCARGPDGECLAGGLVDVLSTPGYLPAQKVAEIIQRTRPDVLLLNEFNFDAAGDAARLFQENYLSIGQNVTADPQGAAASINYPYRYRAPSNTGLHSGFDLDNDGQVASSVGDSAYAGDAFGFGEFPGRYGMLLLSRYPIVTDHVRTFQRFLWRDMPDALLPDQLQTPASLDWYSPEELNQVRLSSKSHWDVPVEIDGEIVHLLASHPTPPVFDGPEDRNGRRNHDEIRLWADYITPGVGDYLVDDHGGQGALPSAEPFVILGDLNADPIGGDSLPGAIDQLLDHPLVNASVVPRSEFGSHITSTFGLRVDYVLPAASLQVLEAGIYAPAPFQQHFALLSASDHRLVWSDVAIANTSVPEPSTCVLVVAAGLLAFFQRRRSECW